MTQIFCNSDDIFHAHPEVRALRGKREKVTVMRDKQLKLAEVEALHTLGGAGEGGIQVEESGEHLCLAKRAKNL